MTREEFIDGIAEIRASKEAGEFRFGLCYELVDICSDDLLDEFIGLFDDNDDTYFWELSTKRGSDQRRLALDIFEQNVLCYETYKEFSV